MALIVILPLIQMYQQKVPLQEKIPTIRADGTYLITGGFGGFGLEVAKWLVKEGARHLVLVSRRGPVTEEAQDVLHELEQQGAQIMTAKADVSVEVKAAR